MQSRKLQPPDWYGRLDTSLRRTIICRSCRSPECPLNCIGASNSLLRRGPCGRPVCSEWTLAKISLETGLGRAGAFDGSRELNGLRVLMALINNWDLKDVNNKIVEKRIHGSIDSPKQEVYFVSDLGASFGPTGIVLGKSRSRGNLAAYRSSKFVTRVTPSYVDFATPSRATWLEAFNPPKYFMRLHLRSNGSHIPRLDAKWL